MRRFWRSFNISGSRYKPFTGSPNHITRWFIRRLSRINRFRLKNVSSPTIFIRFRSGWSHSTEKWKTKSLPYQFFQILFLSRDTIFIVNYCFVRFDTLALFFKYLGSGTEIRKPGTVNSSFFISLSNETNPTEIGRKLWGLLTFLATPTFLVLKDFFLFFSRFLLDESLIVQEIDQSPSPEKNSAQSVCRKPRSIREVGGGP